MVHLNSDRISILSIRSWRRVCRRNAGSHQPGRCWGALFFVYLPITQDGKVVDSKGHSSGPENE
jgi:hypothetical protein